MALLKCKECGAKVSTEAISCQKCGAPAPKSTKGQVLSPDESAKLSIKERYAFQAAGGKILLSKTQKIALGLLFMFIAFLIFKPSAPLTEAEKVAAFKKNALTACRSFIMKSLKNPDSAKFGTEPLDAIAVEKEPNVWYVQRKLRATNSFNAVVPSTMSCTMSHDGQSFSLLSIKNVK